MIYRKRGRVARWEHGTLVEIDEAGEAIEERGVFEVRPLSSSHPSSCHPERSEGSGGAGAATKDIPAAADPPRSLAPLGMTGELAMTVRNVAREIERIARPERLVVAHGFAEHEINGVTWSDETRRVHLAITSHGERALIDRADFDLGDITRIAKAMRRISGEREAPKRLRLAESVTAALLPHLVGRTPPNVTLHQTVGGYDGYGNEIVEMPIDQPPWPNAFRPSYRIRPQRMPMNLRLECDNDDVDRNAPEAIALLAPIHRTTLRVLIVSGKAAYPATITVMKIHAVATNRVWYPYAGGAFGSEIML